MKVMKSKHFNFKCKQKPKTLHNNTFTLDEILISVNVKN